MVDNLKSLRQKIIRHLLNSSVNVIDDLTELYGISKENVIIECKQNENTIIIRPIDSIKEITVSFEIKE